MRAVAKRSRRSGGAAPRLRFCAPKFFGKLPIAEIAAAARGARGQRQRGPGAARRPRREAARARGARAAENRPSVRCCSRRLVRGARAAQAALSRIMTGGELSARYELSTLAVLPLHKMNVVWFD